MSGKETVRLLASDLHTFFQPSKCGLRIYLKHVGMEAAPPGPYEEILFKLGEIHEVSHLNSFSQYADLRKGTLKEREKNTKDVLGQGAPVLYQAVFRTVYTMSGKTYEIYGEPDFLIRNKDGYSIRDSKISRRITEKDHPEILRQLEIYGWLYEQAVDRSPIALQVHSGSGEIIDLPYDSGASALKLFEHIAGLKESISEPYSPVGWSKCGGCSFRGHCWPKAETNRDVALVPGIDQNLAAALKEMGINAIQDLLNNFDANSLSEFKRPWGSRMQKVGKKAGSILLMAQALSERREIMIQSPSILDHPNYVMFDLEGLPPQLDETEKVYLWGLQVFGEDKADFMPALSGFGEKGDEEGWQAFLGNAHTILSKHGDIPFVHWHHYERVKIDMYMERFGDRNGVADRVKANLLDLLPITQRSIALPLPSYSLKQVEKYVGF